MDIGQLVARDFQQTLKDYLNKLRRKPNERMPCTASRCRRYQLVERLGAFHTSIPDAVELIEILGSLTTLHGPKGKDVQHHSTLRPARAGTLGNAPVASAAWRALPITPTVSQRETHDVQHRPPFECTALPLQGGGALAAYQAGVYEALAQAGTLSSQKPPRNSSTPAAAARFRGHMDVQLMVDAMELAEHVDEIVLFSGNGDFPFAGRGGAALRRLRSGFDDFEPVADDRRRVAAPGRRLHRSRGTAVQARPRSVRTPGTARSQSITQQCVRRRGA
jgi:hypothetical protein